MCLSVEFLRCQIYSKVEGYGVAMAKSKRYPIEFDDFDTCLFHCVAKEAMGAKTIF